VHLYIHVPFCARRCSYCDFAIAVRRTVPSGAFADAIEREWLGWQPHPAWQDAPGLDTIYFGGGTPSRLAPHALHRLLARFRADRELAPGAELTLEANPDDVTRESATAWKAAGITRVSLGVQSFDPAALAWMHRTHSAAQAAHAVGLLRDVGLTDISLDLIYALPDSLGRHWMADVERALELAPTHLSLYGLTVEPGTPLGKWTARGETASAPDDRAAAEYLAAHAALESAGYLHYEVSNFARPAFHARHNSAYWRRAPFIGLGPSAHSGLGEARSWNIRDWQEYLGRSEAGEPVVAEAERLTPNQVALEQLYLGLRTSEGVPASMVPPDVLARWMQHGWGMERAGRATLTPEGWLRLDALVSMVSPC